MHVGMAAIFQGEGEGRTDRNVYRNELRLADQPIDESGLTFRQMVTSRFPGLVIEHVCLRPLRRRGAPPITALISTIGLALILVACLGGGGIAW